MWLLADGSEVLWIVGDRISEKYKVSDTTRKILHVEIKGGTITSIGDTLYENGLIRSKLIFKIYVLN